MHEAFLLVMSLIFYAPCMASESSSAVQLCELKNLLENSLDDIEDACFLKSTDDKEMPLVVILDSKSKLYVGSSNHLPLKTIDMRKIIPVEYKEPDKHPKFLQYVGRDDVMIINKEGEKPTGSALLMHMKKALMAKTPQELQESIQPLSARFGIGIPFTSKYEKGFFIAKGEEKHHVCLCDLKHRDDSIHTRTVALSFPEGVRPFGLPSIHFNRRREPICIMQAYTDTGELKPYIFDHNGEALNSIEHTFSRGMSAQRNPLVLPRLDGSLSIVSDDTNSIVADLSHYLIVKQAEKCIIQEKESKKHVDDIPGPFSPFKPIAFMRGYVMVDRSIFSKNIVVLYSSALAAAEKLRIIKKALGTACLLKKRELGQRLKSPHQQYMLKRCKDTLSVKK